jgi:hypothetical protein
MGAADLLRSVGLLADGPATWGRPVASGRPGVYVVEWPEPLADAPIDLASVGKWIERLPAMRLDGRRPTSREVAARLHDFWLPGQVILYIGRTSATIHARVGALYRTPLGDRGPHNGGQWLRTLRGYERARIWWAETDAPEEYEDALFGAFAGSVDASVEAVPRLQDREVVLPFANLQSTSGARKAHGLSGTVEPKPPEEPVPGTTVVDLPAGSAEGAEESSRIRPLEVHERRTSTTGTQGTNGAQGAEAGSGQATEQASKPTAARSADDAPPPPRTGAAAKVDLDELNRVLQSIACRRLVRELTVADAAAELSAVGLLRETRAQPVAVLRDLLKQGLIDGGTQDADRRWTIRCLRR